MLSETQTGSKSPAADALCDVAAEPRNAISLPAHRGRPLKMLSVVIPARDESECIASTVEHLHLELSIHGIPHEIVVVDDGSRDETYAILVRYWQTLQEGHDCVFGSRFMKGGGVIDYPRVKYMVNRMANWFVRTLFGIRLNDTTNAFKAYRKEVIEGCRPFLSPHFNITVELPLKAIVRGYSWTVIPITWRNRRTGVAKLKIREMGSRYFFIVAYVWLEKYFSRGDYRKPVSTKAEGGGGSRAAA
jgi:dolichol-phosphate mannosyltransferase